MIRELIMTVGFVAGLVSFAATHAASPHEERLQSVLREASSPSPDWKAVFREAQRARRFNPDDPRGDYVLAVAHMQRQEFEQAERYFQTAKNRAQGIYFPAWKGLIRLRLLQRDGDEAIRESVSMAETLLDDDTTWHGMSSPNDVGAFLGRVTAFLELQENEWSDAEKVQRLIAPFEDRLSGELFHAYHDGRIALADQHHELQLRVAEAESERKTRLQARTESKANDLREQREEAENSREDLKLTKQELKKRLEKEWADTSRQFSQIQQDHESVTQAAIQMLSLIDRTMTELDRVATLARRGLTGAPIQPGRVDRTTRSPPEQRAVSINMLNLESQLAGYQRRLEALNLQAGQLAQQANGLIARRQQVAQQYQASTGQLLAKDREIERWMNSMNKAEQKLDRQAVASTVTIRLESRLASPAAFFEIDWAKELEQLSLANGSKQENSLNLDR